ncbi:MAG: HEAT repeat domain-containing protein [Gammaproteobacteria bacterium]|nr:HEAT repeat domain-containing protein [Gammaproteobacteria bacterium]
MRKCDYRHLWILKLLVVSAKKNVYTCDEDSYRMNRRAQQGDHKLLDNRGLLRRTAQLACLVGGLILLIDFGNAQQTLMSAQATMQSPPDSLYVKIADEVVTVRARDVAVRDLVKEIARQTDVVVLLYDPLDENITIELDRLPLPEAMGRILRAWNFALQYVEPVSGVAYQSEMRRGRLWVFSRAWEDTTGHDGNVAHSSFDIAPNSGVLDTAAVNEDVGRTEEAIGGLEAPGGDESITTLSLALADDDPEVRLDAVSELADIGSDEASAALAVALGDEDALVREEAVHALGDIGGATANQILEQAFMDTEMEVRGAAIDAFADIGGDESALALAVALRDQDASLREEAVYALGQIRGETAIQVLKHAFMDGDQNVRGAAIEAFTDIGGDESALALAVALRDQDASLREEAVDALGQIGGEAAIRLLQRTIEDEENTVVREAAAETLDELSSQEQ